MLTHNEIWQAIDRLAARHSFSPSGLARRAGLDPTTFNKSKRVARDGRPRWPSTESIAKVLEATGASMDDFVHLLHENNSGGQRPARLPVLGLAAAAMPGHFDATGRPSGADWDEVAFGAIDDSEAYALQVVGDRFAPLYRDGDLLVLSPRAELRHGDRVVVRTAGGEVMVSQFARHGARKIELLDLVSGEPAQALDVEAISFIHRIVWSTQ